VASRGICGRSGRGIGPEPSPNLWTSVLTVLWSWACPRQIAEGSREFVMGRNQFLEPIMPHVTELQRADGSAQPVAKVRCSSEWVTGVSGRENVADDYPAGNLH
jgi:hypothetical protein